MNALPSEALAALHHKYCELVRLARERQDAMARGASGFEGEQRLQRREAMRVLAQRFPGALRELDSLPLGEMEARQEVLAQLLNGAMEAPAWVGPQWGFHQLMRELLHVKRCLVQQRPFMHGWPSPPMLGPGAFEGELLEAVRVPPRGHLSDLAVLLLVQELGCTEEELRLHLFGGTRRPG